MTLDRQNDGEKAHPEFRPAGRRARPFFLLTDGARMTDPFAFNANASVGIFFFLWNSASSSVAMDRVFAEHPVVKPGVSLDSVSISSGDFDSLEASCGFVSHDDNLSGTVLHHAARRLDVGEEWKISDAVGRGFLPDTPDANGRTPLMVAAFSDNPVSAAALLEVGADPLVICKASGGCLHHAASRGSLAFVSCLLAMRPREVAALSSIRDSLGRLPEDLPCPSAELSSLLRAIREKTDISDKIQNKTHAAGQKNRL